MFQNTHMMQGAQMLPQVPQQQIMTQVPQQQVMAQVSQQQVMAQVPQQQVMVQASQQQMMMQSSQPMQMPACNFCFFPSVASFFSNLRDLWLTLMGWTSNKQLG